MADLKALFVVRANNRNLNGTSSAFDIVTGFDDAGQPTYGDPRQIPPGRSVLVLSSDPRTRAQSGTVWRVSPGQPMVALERQPTAGDIVRISCTPDQSAVLSGSIWMCLDDGSFTELGHAIAAKLATPAPEAPQELQPEGA